MFRSTEYVSQSIDANTNTVINDIIYVWVTQNFSPDERQLENQLLFNTPHFPFLQHAIDHAAYPGSSHTRKVHIVYDSRAYIDSHVEKFMSFGKPSADVEKRHRQQTIIIREYFKNLEKLSQEASRNMAFHDFRELICQDEKLNSEVSAALKDLPLAHVIDIIKITILGNLRLLNLDCAILSDFDTKIPENFSVNFDRFTVISGINQDFNNNTKPDCDESGWQEHGFENSLTAVKGSHNQVCERMRALCQRGHDEYFAIQGNPFRYSHSITHGVYTVYIVEILRSINPEENRDLTLEQLQQKYPTLAAIEAVAPALLQFKTIPYERGNSWMQRRSGAAHRMPNFSPGTHVVDFDELCELMELAKNPRVNAHRIIEVLRSFESKQFDFKELTINHMIGPHQHYVFFSDWEKIKASHDLFSELKRLNVGPSNLMNDVDINEIARDVAKLSENAQAMSNEIKSSMEDIDAQLAAVNALFFQPEPSRAASNVSRCLIL